MCPIGFLMLGSPCKTCRAIRPPHADQPAPGGEPRCAPAPTNEPSSRAPGLPWSATRSTWPLPNHLPRRRPDPNRHLGWPSTACASFKHEAPTQADDEPAWTQRATTPTPTIPAIRLPAHPALQDLTSAGHSARGNPRTPDADTGRRTADTWTPQTPAPDTGHRSRGQASVDTGHRTPDTGRWPRTWTG